MIPRSYRVLDTAAQINSRMGGGGVYQINKLVWGVDLVEEQLLAVCSIPSKPYLPDSPLHFLAEYSVNAKVSGVLQNDDFLEVRGSMPGTPW